MTLSSNDQPGIRAFSIGKEGSALGACSQNWERFGSELPNEASFGSGSKGVGGAPTQHRTRGHKAINTQQNARIQILTDISETNRKEHH